MKKLLLILFTFSSVNLAISQAVVADTGAYAYLAQAVANGTESLNKVNEQINIAKEATEKLSAVKSAISQGKLVSGIYQNVSSIGKNLKKLPDLISHLKFKKVQESFIEQSIDITVQVDILTELLSNSIQEGTFEANDLDRVNLLYDLYKETLKLKNTVNNLMGSFAYQHMDF